MTESASREELRKWVENWQRVGPELEQIRRTEIRAANTSQSVRLLFGEESLVCVQPSHPSSRLVEQQAWFAKLRR